jgi:16S rRNA G527 N7-methylase RsmG
MFNITVQLIVNEAKFSLAKHRAFISSNGLLKWEQVLKKDGESFVKASFAGFSKDDSKSVLAGLKQIAGFAGIQVQKIEVGAV